MTIPAAVAEGRVNIAFNDNTLEPFPTWSTLDNTDNLVASYTIDRGRQYETDRTDGGRATVAITDREGILDPTNGGGPYYGLIEPLLQITLGRWNPVLAQWQTRFRGFISDYDYSFDPSQRVNRLTLACVDIFEILNTIQMLPDGTFGNPPPVGSEGNVFYEDRDVNDRIAQALADAFIPTEFFVVFTGNVNLYETVYSPGESPLAVIAEAADAEFPGVANVYPDRFGRLVFHGRLAKFDPEHTAADAGDDQWDWNHWDAGDGAAVAAAPSSMAHIREFAFNRGLSQVINQASATPLNIDKDDIAGQVVTDTGSVALRGIRSWSVENLLTKTGLLDSSDALTETKRFAQWRVDTHADPRNRVTNLTLKSMRPGAPGAAITWRLLCEADIADQVDITVGSPGGGGFADAPFFIEGIHETNVPLNGDYDMVTMSLDVSPQDYASDPESRFPTP